MAGAQCATTTSFLPSSATVPPNPREPVLLCSSISNPFPRKLTRRKNYLRQKLLFKTLTKPYPNHLLPGFPPTNPEIPGEPLQKQHLESQSDQIAGEETRESETREFQVSDTSGNDGVQSGSFGIFSTGSVLKVGLYLVGAFVFQTICAVWVFGSAKSDHKDGNLNTGGKTGVLGLGVNGNRKAKSSVLLDRTGNSSAKNLDFKQGGFPYLGGPELQEKIVEIQAMARDSRQREQLDSKAKSDVIVVKTGIGKEVEGNLIKLRKKLQKSSEKPVVFPVSYLRKDDEVEDVVNGDSLDSKDVNKPLISYLRKDDEVEDGVNGDSLDSKDVNKPLMFKKKYKFRSPSANLRDKPKGFMGSEDQRITKGRNDGSAIKDDPGRNGATQEAGFERGSIEATRLRKSSKSDAQNTSPREVRNQGAVGRFEADLWWLSLPYVLAILMRRGHDGEGPKGLFTVKTSSYTMDEGCSSYTVAFEDRGDATNFCYLLQSFFENLGDFSTDIVPLSIKEVEEAVNSQAMKVIVVKKGQLKLYAGQPLEEVEMALRSLVK